MVNKRSQVTNANYPRHTICYGLHNYLLLADKGGYDMIFRMACARGHLDVVDYLCRYYLDLIYIDSYDDYAFRMACQNGHLGTVKYLIDMHRAKIDISSKNYAAIKKACTNNRLDVLQLLIKHYGDAIKASDAAFFSDATLATVCKNGWDPIIRILVSTFGREFQAASYQGYRQALKYVCQRNQINTIKFILDEIIDDKIKATLVNKSFEWMKADTDPKTNNEAYFKCILAIINSYRKVVTEESINYIFLACCTFWPKQAQPITARTVFDIILGNFKACLTVHTRCNALKSISLKYAQHAFVRILNEFVNDLTNDVINQAFYNACYYGIEPYVETLMGKYYDRLTAFILDSTFVLLCKNGMIDLASELEVRSRPFIKPISYTQALTVALRKCDGPSIKTFIEQYGHLVDASAINSHTIELYFPNNSDVADIFLSTFRHELTDSLVQTLIQIDRDREVTDVIYSHLGSRI